MPHHELHLQAIPGTWRLFAARRVDPAFAAFSEKVFNRDNHTCQYCGFQARQYQEVVNLDGNYRHNKMSNMVTACVFCTQCLFLEAVGQGNEGGGHLIYLPEIEQRDLNGLCHVLFCAIANATTYRSDAQNIYRNLKLRSQIVDEKLDEKMSSPTILGQLLIDTDIEDREDVHNKLLKNLRLLPSRTRFNKHIETWAKSALEELSSE